MKISAYQIDQASLSLVVQQTTSVAAFSGNMVSYVENYGFIGPTALWTTGGSQQVTGSKRFLDPILVNYSGGTGAAPSARWVNDQILASTSSISSSIAAVSGYALGISGALSLVQVTGSNTLPVANFSGVGGTQVFLSGGMVIISGGAGGGGGGGGAVYDVVYTSGDQSITGFKTFLYSPQIPEGMPGDRPLVLSSAVSYVDLVAVSGVLASGGGGGSPNSVTTTGNETIGGFKQFTGSPFVPAPTAPSGAANLSWVSGVSGVLIAHDLDISGVLYSRMTGISGAIGGGGSTTNYFITGTGVISVLSNASGNITNTFGITSGNTSVVNSGTATNTFNVTNGNVTMPLSLSGITGNFVNMSFWFDQNNLSTGLNTIEAFVGRDFFFTGYSVGAINSGTQGMFSGSFYQRTQNNTKVSFVNFGMTAGLFFTGRGGFSQVISGMNRVGLDILSIGTGLTGVSVGLFGVGY